MSNIAKIYNFGAITDDSEKNRLSLFYVSHMVNGKEEGYDFHSLLWEKVENNQWAEKKVITEEEFDSDPLFRKWVSNLHSFYPEKGYAIIKLGEEDAPRNSNNCKVIYSWRKWNLYKNEQVEMLKICDSPFEEYSDEKNS